MEGFRGVGMSNHGKLAERDALNIFEIEKMYSLVCLKDNHVTVLDRKSYR